MAKESMDTLELKIMGNARSANNAIDKLVKNLGTLSTALNGINASGLASLSKSVATLAPAMKQVGSIDSRNFTTLAKNITKLSSIDSTGLEKSARAITSMSASIQQLGNVSGSTTQVNELASSISKLGYKGVTNAITNIPRLATALKDFMRTMSNAPKVSINAIRMTEAIAKLADSLKGVRTSTQHTTSSIKVFASAFTGIDKRIGKVTDKLKGFIKQTDKAEKSSKGLVSTIGMLYAKFWLLGRAVGALGKSIKSSMDYIEVLNYFDKSFEQVASNAVAQWKDAGYESAQSYYESFSKRAKVLTAKMTGFDVDDSGMLQATGATSLGINPTSVMNYQAMFAQMSSSMGVASENALALSNALTQIGADLASVKNMGFEEVWQDLTSGLAGMSRTLDKYGVNIRDTAMQQKLTELGIDETIKSLGQQDKALLRTIILLESTKYAWGDLSETLNQPANQLRLLTSNIKMLCQMIGNLFIPLVSALLPYLNGLVVALQRLVIGIASALGMADKLRSITSSTGETSDAFSTILDEAENTNSELEDMEKTSKKIKQNLLGIDELNVISEDTSSTTELETPNYSDILNDAFWKALNDYQNAWDEAFKNTENSAQKIADAIEEKFKFAIEPIKIAWDSEGDFVIEGWKHALEEIKKLVSDIGRDFSKVWHSAETVDIFEDIFHIIGDIGLAIGNLAEGFREAWNHNDNGYKILCNIRDIIGAIIGNIRQAADYTVEWAKDLDFIPLLTAVERLTGKLADKMEDISGIFTDFYEIVVLGILKHIIEVSIPNLINAFTKFIDKVDWEKLRANFKKIWEAMEHLGSIIADGLIIVLGDLLDAIAEFVNSETFQKLVDMFTSWVQTLTAEDIAGLLEKIFKAFLLYKGLSFLVQTTLAIDKFVKAVKGLELVKGIGTVATAIGTALGNLGKSKVPDVGEAMANGQKTTAPLPMDLQFFGDEKGMLAKISSIAKAIGGVVAVVGGAITAFSNFFAMLENGFNGVNEAFMLLGIAVAGIGAVMLGANPVVALAIGGIVAIIGTAIPLIKDNWGDIKQFFSDTWTKIKDGASEGWTNIQNTLVGLWQGIKDTATNTWNGFSEFFSGIWNGIQETSITVWGTITTTLSELWTNIGVVASETWSGITSFFATVWDGVYETASDFWTKTTDFLSKTWNGIKQTAEKSWDNVKKAVQDCWNDIKAKVLPVIEEFKQGVEDKWNKLKENVSTIVESIKEETKTRWENLKSDVVGVIENLKTEVSTKWEELKVKMGEAIKNIGDDVVQKWNGIKETIVTTVEEVKNEAVAKWDDFKQNVSTKFEEIRSTSEEKWGAIKENINGKVGEIKSNFDDFVDKFNQKKNEWLDNFEDRVSSKFEGVRKAISDKWENVKTDTKTFFDGFAPNIGNWASNMVTNFVNSFQNLPTKLSGVFDNVKNIAQNAFNTISDWASKIWDKMKEITNASSSTSTYRSGSSFPRYATGGFPEDGFFFANHTELVGKFSNGKTAVANNEQIVAGIAQGVYKAMVQANAENTRQESLLEELIVAVKEGKSISIDGRDIVTAYDSRKARNGFAF